MISDDGSERDGRVTFWARGKQKSAKDRHKNRSEPYELSGQEFVRRWSMHISPKGFTRSRSYGGYHSSKRKAYLARSRVLLGCDATEVDEPTKDDLDDSSSQPSVPTCRHCKTEMICIEQSARPSWKQIFERDIYLDGAAYSPMHHLPNSAPNRKPNQPQDYG